MHSCDAWTKDGEGVGDVGGFDGAVFNCVVSHNFHKLGTSRVVSHGLRFAGHNGIFDFALGEVFVMLVDGLYHGNGVHWLHVDVGESTAYAILLMEEGDFFALGGGDDPIAASVVADSESICLQLGEREEIVGANADSP